MPRHIDRTDIASGVTQDARARWFKAPARPWRQPAVDISAFSIRSIEKLFFVDVDRTGHISNSLFAASWQHARSELLCNPSRVPLPDGMRFAVISLQLDFLGEMHWPATIEIGTRVERIGRASVTIGQGLFLGVRCIARSQSVVVLMDRATRRATVLPAPLISALCELGTRESNGRASAVTRIRRAITGMKVRA
jgi:acyl-CoA thioester hydrolase